MMQEVHSKDGDIVHVLDAEDLDAAKNAVIEYLGKALRWVLLVGIPTLVFATFAVASILRDVSDMKAEHEKWRPIMEAQAQLAREMAALGLKLDRAHDDITTQDSAR